MCQHSPAPPEPLRTDIVIQATSMGSVLVAASHELIASPQHFPYCCKTLPHHPPTPPGSPELGIQRLPSGAPHLPSNFHPQQPGCDIADRVPPHELGPWHVLLQHAVHIPLLLWTACGTSQVPAPSSSNHPLPCPTPSPPPQLVVEGMASPRGVVGLPSQQI